MARDTVSPEGLTFEEWVCAAGVAARMTGWDGDAWPDVKPFAEYWTHYDREVAAISGNVYRYNPKRRSIQNYPTKIRKAWRDGEDPTEWRA